MELSTKQPVAAETGWRHTSAPSLPEANGSIPVPNGLRGWKAWLRWIGPGFMVAVGYMDPGNWATSLAGGAQFQYTLLSVILISNLMAIFLQALCVRLGIVTGRDLAQACHDAYPRPVGIGLWVLAEIAIAATDLAEVIGSAIALKLLFGLPLLVGVCITALDVLVILVLQGRGFRFIEALVMVLIGTIATIFGIEIVLSQPELGPVVGGLIPSSTIVFNPDALYVAIGILGATVMPHNLYLHSSIVQTRAFDRTSVEAKRLAIRHATIDSTVALMGALFINASILIVAAAVFHANGYFDVQSIEDAHALLAPLLGTGAASILFALALLASGQNSTLTGTLAGQIVMEGFLSIRLRPWLRRLITRLLAIIPAVIVTLISGERGTVGLLIASQVVLSMQLPFAVFPLLQFTGDRAKMGEFATPRWAKILGWGIGIFIALLNVILLWQTATGL